MPIHYLPGVPTPVNAVPLNRHFKRSDADGEAEGESINKRQGLASTYPGIAYPGTVGPYLPSPVTEVNILFASHRQFTQHYLKIHWILGIKLLSGHRLCSM